MYSLDSRQMIVDKDSMEVAC